MYKTPDGHTKFSFTRLMNNAEPMFANPVSDADFNPHEQDLLFQSQLHELDPLVLSPIAFQVGGVTDSEKVSASIHKALLKHGIISESAPMVNTQGITKQFPHQVAMVGSHKQKKLINLLFFWEEECQRWKVLIEELDELKTVMHAEQETGGATGTYEKRVKEIQGLLRVLPTMRSQIGKSNEALPPYQEGARPPASQQSL